MAKKPNAVVVTEHFTIPQSLEDAGFQWGRTGVQQGSIAKYIMDQVPGLGDPDVEEQLPKEQKDRLKVGLMNHYGENIKSCRYYVIADNNAIEKSETEWNEYQGEKRRLDVHVAFGMDLSTLTYLRENEKDWYKLVQELKTDFNKYFSNSCREIVAKAKRIFAEKHNLKRERASTLTFSIREKKVLDDLLQKCITADRVGNDSSANVALTKKRIAAYFAVTA